MTTAPINRIIPLSTVDGPGARTVVFFQGCNIACAYCHNPETQLVCRNCGACMERCPSGALSLARGIVAWDPKACTGCDECIRACPHFSSPRAVNMTPAALMEQIRKSVPFIRGITASGGECTLYPQFLTELFRLAKAEGLTCLIDSNGTVDFTLHAALTALCDGVMLDVKAWNDDIFHALTGQGNTIVKKNLTYLSGAGKLEEVRVVCLEEYVDAANVIRGAAETLGSAAADTRLKLIAFRSSGVRGKLRDTPPPSPQTMRGLAAMAEKAGFANIIVV